MFWDRIAGMYDLFENLYNRKVYPNIGRRTAAYITREDTVLECACGTGAITRYIAEACRRVVAVDLSTGMLKEAKKKLRAYRNITFRKADLTALRMKADAFDVVAAGNVLHLLPEPQKAMEELTRVCRDGGKLIIPTYIDGGKGMNRLAVRILERLGAHFKRQFDAEGYEAFFREMGYEDVRYETVEGRMPCKIAVIIVHKKKGNPRTGEAGLPDTEAERSEYAQKS